MIRAIIFDLWGTLAYHNNNGNESYISGLVSRIGDPSIKRTFHDTFFTNEYDNATEAMTTIGRSLFPEQDVTPLVQFLENNFENTHVYDDVLGMLKKLKKHYKLALLSNTDNLCVQYLPEELLALFDVTAFSYKTKIMKPQPEAFTHLSQTLQIPPQDLVVIGDSIPSDTEGAKGAHMHTILIDRENHDDGISPKISSLTELPRALEAIQKTLK